MAKRRLKTLRSLFAIALVIGLAACSSEPQTGVDQVRWDRDACDRCRMVLSEHNFAAQVRYFPEGKRSKVAKFDDIGCAVIWLEDETWKQDPKTEIWVADHRSGEWIDARQATYVHKNSTPMEYGLGAQMEPAEGGLNFVQAQAHIHDIEKRHNKHGGHAHHHPVEQVDQLPPISETVDY